MPVCMQVIVGNASWRFGAYLSYCRNGSELDEMPLYMFDKVWPHLHGVVCVVCICTHMS
jgi:hypothetical protein